MNSFQCPYDDLGCVYIDTSGMSKLKECSDCEHYKNSVKTTNTIWERIKKFFKPKDIVRGSMTYPHDYLKRVSKYYRGELKGSSLSKIKIKKTKEQEKQEMEDWNNFMMGL